MKVRKQALIVVILNGKERMAVSYGMVPGMDIRKRCHEIVDLIRDTKDVKDAVSLLTADVLRRSGYVYGMSEKAGGTGRAEKDVQGDIWKPAGVPPRKRALDVPEGNNPAGEENVRCPGGNQLRRGKLHGNCSWHGLVRSGTILRPLTEQYSRKVYLLALWFAAARGCPGWLQK